MEGIRVWGVYYDITKLELPRGSFGADQWIAYYWTLDNSTGPRSAATGTPGTAAPARTSNRWTSGTCRTNPRHDLVEPNLKPYRAQELTFGLDHELSRTMSVGVRYVHKWLDRDDRGRRRCRCPGVGEVFYIANPGRASATNILGPQYPGARRSR